MRSSRMLLAAGAALLACLVVGCKGEEKAEASEAPAVTPQMEAKLAAADALDGTVDKIVTKCPSCGLGMNGNSENSLMVGDYELYFCNGEREIGPFEADLETNVLALNIPEK